MPPRRPADPPPLKDAQAAPPARFRVRALLILWPAFVMAGVLEMLVFVVVDPASLHWFGIEPLRWTSTAIYSVTFLIFWGVISTSTATTLLLLSPMAEPGEA
jgi:hypothetical protein